jgi:hypothetical protein
LRVKTVRNNFHDTFASPRKELKDDGTPSKIFLVSLKHPFYVFESFAYDFYVVDVS